MVRAGQTTGIPRNRRVGVKPHVELTVLLLVPFGFPRRSRADKWGLLCVPRGRAFPLPPLVRFLLFHSPPGQRWNQVLCGHLMPFTIVLYHQSVPPEVCIQQGSFLSSGMCLKKAQGSRVFPHCCSVATTVLAWSISRGRELVSISKADLAPAPPALTALSFVPLGEYCPVITKHSSHH